MRSGRDRRPVAVSPSQQLVLELVVDAAAMAVGVVCGCGCG